MELTRSAVDKVATSEARRDWSRYGNVARCEMLAAQSASGFFGAERAIYLTAYLHTLAQLSA